jgi:N-acetylmuramoyl-L-alanine amidase
MKIVISSGHGKYIRGASGIIDEVDEARRVVDRVAEYLREGGVDVKVFHDNTSTTQDQNLHTIVAYHNTQQRDLDVSVHFNCYETTSKPMGCEVLYVTQDELAEEVSAAIADAGGLIDRGEKYRGDLYFLNNTEQPAILIETCFVDSSADVEAYEQNFEVICEAIAAAISGEELVPIPPEPEPPEGVFRVIGKCSSFGGPEDTGVSASEGLAFIYNYDDAPHLFLPQQPEGTTGLARRLNPGIFYVACRWPYDEYPKGMLANSSLQALVRAGDREFLAWPADWGPHEDTGRVADLSPGLMEALGLTTDDQVEVIYPAKGPVSV